MGESVISMPFLLRVAMALGAVFGVFGTVIGTYGLVRIGLGDGPYRINEDVASKADFLRLTVPFLVLYVAACVTAGAASWALWRRRTRSRPLLTLLLMEFVIGDAAMLLVAHKLFGVSGYEALGSALFFVVLVALGLWYLFAKESVVQYYDSIGTGLISGSAPRARRSSRP